MRNREISRDRSWLPILGPLVLSFLCGGGPAWGITAQDRVNEGLTLLGTTPHTVANLLKAHEKFAQALVVDPSHEAANALFAVTRLLTLPYRRTAADDPSELDSVNEMMNAFGVTADPSGTGARNIYDWKAEIRKNIFKNIILPPNAPTGGRVVEFILEAILPEIEGALENLGRVSDSFTILLTGPQAGGRPGSADVFIDAGDIRVGRAALLAARAAIRLLNSYNVDVDLGEVVSKISNHQFQVKRDLLDRFPNTLTPMNCGELGRAKLDLAAAIEAYLAGSDFIRARMNDGRTDHLLVIDASNDADEMRFRRVLKGVQSALLGPAVVDLRQRPSIVLDLSRFFDGCPNLRSFIPTINDKNDVVPGTFPDPTVAGIAPDMTQEGLARVLGAPFFGNDWEPYDFFEMPPASQTRWAAPQEFVREVRAAKFFSKLARYGSDGFNNLPFTNPGPITEIQAQVAVTEVRNTGVLPVAFLGGFFYNDGSGIGNVGDVNAQVRIQHNGTRLEAAFRVGKCTGTPCTLSTGTFEIFATQVLGPVNLNEAHTLMVRWDPVQGLFTFGLDGATQVFDPKPFTPVFNLPPGTPSPKAIGTAIFLQVGDPFRGGAIGATFDDVRVNGTLYDDFAAAMLDPTRWAGLREAVREVSGGTYNARFRLVGVDGQTSMAFRNPEAISSMRADVRVNSVQNASASLQARLAGTFSRVGRFDPITFVFEQKDVWAHISLTHDGTNLLAQYFVGLCDDPSCTTITGMTPGGAPVTIAPISMGTTHRLSVDFDFVQFRFRVDDAEATLPVFGGPCPPCLFPFGDAVFKFKGLQLRVGGTQGDQARGGFIAATFDNVFVMGSGRIHGEVTYGGNLSGPIRVRASGPTVAETTIPGPGEYKLRFVPGGRYTVQAFMDLNGNGLMEAASEPSSPPVAASLGRLDLALADPRPAVPLTVIMAGNGSGVVRSSPTGIVCPLPPPGTCAVPFSQGAPVKLTAEAGGDSVFAGWGGDGTGTTDRDVTMDGPKSVTATFTKRQFTLTVNKAGTGTGSVTGPAGLSCGTACQSAQVNVDVGTPVALGGTADPGSEFTGFGGDAGCAGGSFSMTGSRTCTATFAKVLPDLVVTFVAGPPLRHLGQQMTLTAVVRNQGRAAAGPSEVGFYLSADQTIDAASDRFLGAANVSGLAPGASRTVVFTTAQSLGALGVVPGNYFVGAVADRSGAVTEAGEGNNARAGNAVQITAGAQPDLVITFVAGPPLRATSQTLTAIAVVRNQGAGPAGPFAVGFFLSPDQVISGATDRSLGAVNLPAGLLPGASQLVTLTTAQPLSALGVAAGNYFMGAVADNAGAVNEANEGNNARAGTPIQVTSGSLPDLVVSFVAGPASRPANNTLTLVAVVRNQGAAAAGPFAVGFFLSPDGTIDPNTDTFLGAVTLAAGLGPGASRTVSFTTPQPLNALGVSPGTYRIGAVADHAGAVTETDDANNARAGNTIVVAP